MGSRLRCIVRACRLETLSIGPKCLLSLRSAPRLQSRAGPILNAKETTQMFRNLPMVLAATATLLFGASAAQATYSIAARDPETGQMAVGVQSNTIAVGSRTRWGQAGVAAIASQASSNPMMGEVGVLLIQRGFTATEARDMLVKMDNGANNRQFAIVDYNGDSAGWTGTGNSEWAGHICQPNFCVQANTMTGPEVVEAMALAYVAATEQGLPFFERILVTLEAAEAAGGDRRGTQSAGIIIYDKRTIAGYGDWAIDLRVDESDNPLAELRRIWNVRIAAEPTQGLNDIIAAGKFEDALARIGRALELDPGRDAAYVQMAQVRVAMNDVPGAVAALAKAIEINPKQYNQLLRNEAFSAVTKTAEFRALGDFTLFAPLKPSVRGGEGLPMPARQ